MLRLFRPKPPQNPAEATKVDSIHFPFLSRLWFRLWPFAGRNFFEGIVTLAAKMAASDGAISETELKLFTRLLDTHFSLSKKQKIRARRFLFKATSSGQTYSECLHLFYKRFKNHPVLLENAFDVLLSMAYSDNIVSYAEQELLAESASVFNLDKRTLDRLTARHHNWKTQFERKRTVNQQKTDNNQQNQQQSQKTNYQQSSQQKSKENLSDFVKAFEESWSDILGVSKTASPSEVKRAYRKLVRAYHPDALPSDLPPEMMRSSVERFIEIQKAYEQYLRSVGSS